MVVDLADARLSYTRTGSGEGRIDPGTARPVVLLIQGVGVIGAGWGPQIDGLGQRFDLISFDNRGIGASSTTGGALTIETMAADAVAILDAQGVERAHIVGHSMGGVIAQALALARPDRVKSLALLCTFARGRQATALSASMLVTALRTRIGTRRMRRLAFLELVMPPGALEVQDRDALAERLGRLFGHDLADQPPIVMRQLRAMGRYDAFDRLALLAGIPTLVVSAQDDRIARPTFGRALAAAIPDARFVEIPGAGHGVTIQCADDINALLRQHLTDAELAASRT
jgi:pimeloyl-ACP methyl ester carboxylesterase